MLDVVLDTLPVALFWKDLDSRLLGCNQKFANDSGVASPADLIGRTNFDFYAPEQAAAFRADDLEVITTGVAKLGIEESLLLPTGKTVWIQTDKLPMRDKTGNVVGVLGIYRDVARRFVIDEHERFSLELATDEQAAALAMRDTLTGLPNRRRLLNELQTRVLQPAPGEHLAIVALNLDRFKAINELYGHAVGDELLQKTAALLSNEVGAGGFVARVGGDEFVLLIPYESDAGLIDTLSALDMMFDMPITLGQEETIVGATLGVATTSANGVDPELLMRRADLALYDAEEQGRAKFAFFESRMESAARERASLERELRIAIKHDHIIPYYQPLVHLGTGEVSCYEILARWPHAEQGLIHPGQFIKLAEERGLIGELTMNLLRRACREVLHWPNAPRIALNIAPVQLLDPALPQSLLKVLSECGFSPARLEIEITEDALIADIDVAQVILASLKELGVRVALDDFGIGYSRLQHLRELSIDVLKIDQSFVQAMDDSEDALTLVKAIVQLGKTLGLAVTAEGIETASQAVALHALGCERGQGFFLGRPLPGYGPGVDLGNLDDKNDVESKVRA
jgi:diguanylate cyclase (GGDEF)-like protein/PAS domain S-box-containing protein